MAVVIGIRYEQTKSKLVDLIREGKIMVTESPGENNGCYFCGKPITGKMKVLVEKYLLKDIEQEDNYSLDQECYEKSSYSMYLDGTWSSLH